MGDTGSVLLVQGFGVPIGTVAPLRRSLAGAGWPVATASIGWNVGCGEVTVERVLDQVEALVAAGGPVVLVGHSRGGLIGRVAAVRRPELFAGLVTVCTPWAIGPPDRPGVATMSALIRAARRHGLRTMGSIDCDHGPCCTRFRAEMGEVPAVPWAALWSSTDAIGGPDSMPPAGPDHVVDLRTSHLGSVRSAAGRRAIAGALDQLGLAPRQ